MNEKILKKQLCVRYTRKYDVSVKYEMMYE